LLDVTVPTIGYFQELRRVVVGLEAYAVWLVDEGYADAA